MILNSIDVYQYHLAHKHSPKSSTHNPNFEVYVYIFSYFMTNIILLKICSIRSNFSIFFV
jgi:hypothetical protein